MANRSVRRSRLGRALALGAGLLLLGVPVFALAKDPPKDKADAKPADAPKATPKLTLATKDTSVAEMVHLINDKLAAQWTDNKIKPSEPCTDHEFIRRASLDIVGRIATPKEIKEFLAQPRETRRSWLVDKLLASDDYPRNWAAIWPTWLLSRSGYSVRG